MNEHLIYEVEGEGLIIKTYGRAVPFDPVYKDQSNTILALEALTGDVPYKMGVWQRLPGETNTEGRRTVLVIGNGRPVDAEKKVYQFGTRYDGLILTTPGTMGIMMTSDCPVVVGFDTTGTAPPFMAHCGRDALHDIDSYSPRESVIFRTLELWTERGGDLKNLRGYIFMGIAPEHFNNERYPHIVEAFRREWGRYAVPDYDRQTIDLVWVIRQQLKAAGVPSPEDSFVHDGLDTFSNERLASLRAGKRDKQNVVVVVRT